MAILAPFVVKLYSYPPSKENCAKNMAHIDYIDKGSKKDEEIHMQYIHERPGSCGLFNQDGMADLNVAKSELKNHKGVVWRGVVSLREDEATRINHLDKSDWMRTLQSSFPEIADKLGIPESNLRWTAAYHDKAGHPHCHIVFWEQKPERLPNRFSRAELRDIKKVIINKTYECERERLLVEKTYFRDSLRSGVRDILGLRKEIQAAAKIVKAEIGDCPKLPPRMSEQQVQELMQKLHNLSDKLPGRGRVALKFMPQEVKAEIRDIADWVLRQPGFRQETEKYLEAHTQITKIYTFQKSSIDKARRNTYGDLRKRISQDLLKAAVQIQRQGRNKIGKEKETSVAILPKEVTQEITQEITTEVTEASNREVIMTEPTDSIDDRKPDYVSSIDSSSVPDREMPDIEMVLHSQRAIMAIEQISKATAQVVRENTMEASWTLKKMHEALTKIGASQEQIRDIVTRWATDAGIKTTVNSVLQRTYDGENDIDFMSKIDWNRLRDNLGYHEHELLNPWMGKMKSVEQQENEQENEWIASQPIKPVNPPDLVPKYIPAVLEVFKIVAAKPELLLDKEELQWTIWTSSWVLKELGVDTQTRLQILNDWVQRSGIEMSMARVADTIHRGNLVDDISNEEKAPRWLGQDNWERLMRNLGADYVPERPWQYPVQGFSFAGMIWKGLWQSIQRERSKAEYQARRLEMEQERERREKSQGGRER